MQSVARSASISFICFVLAVGVTAQNPTADVFIDRDFLVRPLELTAQPLPLPTGPWWKRDTSPGWVPMVSPHR